MLKISVLLLTLSLSSLFSQGLYPPDRVIKMEIEFYDENYMQLLKQNKEDKIEILARLKVDDELILDSVGVRYKGNSSYNIKSNKKPFNISVDAVIEDQRLWGYKTLNLNNAFVDPTFMRENIANRIFGNYMPSLKTGYVYLYVNGIEYGLYSNVEQLNKDFLGEWYESKSGNLYKGDPRGELTWKGNDPQLYVNDYEKKTNEDEDDWSDLVQLINVINNSTNLSEDLPEIMNTDRTLWYFALCNVFVNLDSYIFSSHNYYLYNDPMSGRFDILPWDMNEAFGVFPPNLPFAKEVYRPVDLKAPNRTPMLKNMLSDDHFRMIYLAHYRTILREFFTQEKISQMIEEIKPVIEKYVQQDPIKLYTFENFETNINEDVNADGRSVPGLLSFVNVRSNFLSNQMELNKQEPEIISVSTSPQYLEPGGIVHFNSELDEGKIEKVELHWRFDYDRFLPVEMKDDGIYPDEIENDNIYSIDFEIPEGTAGKELCFYVTAINSENAMKFYPERAEFEYLTIKIEGALSNSDVVINEFMASNATVIQDPQGAYPDWIELYNKTNDAISLNGWFLTDDPAEIDKWEFSDATIEPNGYLLIWADDDEEDVEGIHTNYKLSKDGEYIGLYDADGNLIDSYTFNEQTTDVSEGRYPNATGDFTFMTTPTPGSKNIMTSFAEETKKDNTVIISPNPASDHLVISSASIKREQGAVSGEIKVYNAFGECLINYELQITNYDKTRIDISHLPVGIYFIKISNYSEKFMVVR